ncbi:MAG TPA: HEAT repeat domain-containing protein [Gemmataceae bacterium]|nr:HEAT repeat domain-containing protein [Gemmataceae bacterium]
MERRYWPNRKKLLVLLLGSGLLILAGVGWVERTPLLVYYAVHRLRTAEASERQPWVDKVAGLDVVALPQLVECLRQDEPEACANVRAGVQEMVQRWELDDPRRVQLAEQLADRFAEMSEEGALLALEIQENLFRGSLTISSGPDLLPAVARMIREAVGTVNTRVHLRALGLAATCVEARPRPELIDTCRKITLRCLTDQAQGNRIEAIRFAARPEVGAHEAVVPLLNDPVPEVRRAAILALGPAPAALNTDDLLTWLHDTDSGVRSLCETALRSRGLEPEHIKLGRLMTDRRPETRLQVIDQLRRVSDLEPGVWLRRLSHDPAPAVRAAAVRAAAEQAVPSLKDRLEQMAQNDPCPSIRQLAQYYLSSQKSGFADLAER